MNFLEKLSNLYENEKNIAIDKYKKSFLVAIIYLFICSIGISSLLFELDETKTTELCSILVGIIISFILAILFLLNTLASTIIFSEKCKINAWLSMYVLLVLAANYLFIPIMIFGDNSTSFVTSFQLMTVVHPLILMGLFFKFELKNDIDSDFQIALNNKKDDLFNDYFIANEPIFKEKNNQILFLNLLLEKNENNTLSDDIKNELTLADKFNETDVKYIIEPNSIFVEFIKDVITKNNFIDEVNQMKNILNNEMTPIHDAIQEEIKKQKHLIKKNQFIIKENNHWSNYHKLGKLEKKEIDLLKQLNDTNIQLNQDVIDKWKTEIEQIKQEKEKYAEEMKQKTLDLEMFIRNRLIDEFNKNK